jgi:hypothetical protein
MQFCSHAGFSRCRDAIVWLSEPTDDLDAADIKEFAAKMSEGTHTWEPNREFFDVKDRDGVTGRT